MSQRSPGRAPTCVISVDCFDLIVVVEADWWIVDRWSSISVTPIYTKIDF